MSDRPSAAPKEKKESKPGSSAAREKESKPGPSTQKEKIESGSEPAAPIQAESRSSSGSDDNSKVLKLPDVVIEPEMISEEESNPGAAPKLPEGFFKLSYEDSLRSITEMIEKLDRKIVDSTKQIHGVLSKAQDLMSRDVDNQAAVALLERAVKESASSTITVHDRVDRIEGTVDSLVRRRDFTEPFLPPHLKNQLQMRTEIRLMDCANAADSTQEDVNDATLKVALQRAEIVGPVNRDDSRKDAAVFMNTLNAMQASAVLEGIESTESSLADGLADFLVEKFPNR